MSESSIAVTFIPTSWPMDRQRIKKKQTELAELSDESTDVWKSNVFDKYKRRSEELNDLTLAQFASQYICDNNGKIKKSRVPKIIRYVNYNMTTQFDDCKREMVTLHMPFRDEENEILAESKFLQIYTENQDIIL